MLASKAIAQDLARPDWCIVDDTADSAVARRNTLVGLWAGSLIGLTGEALERYAREVVAADCVEAGTDDLVAKLQRDLSARGFPLPVQVIRRKIQDCHRAALQHVCMTD